MTGPVLKPRNQLVCWGLSHELPRERHLPPRSSLGYTADPEPGHSQTEVSRCSRDLRPTAGTLPVPEVHGLGTVTLFTHLLLHPSERRLDPTARKLSGKTRTSPQGRWRSQRPRWAIHRFSHRCLSPRDLPGNPFLYHFISRCGLPLCSHAQLGTAPSSAPISALDSLCASPAHGGVPTECSLNPLEHDPGPRCSRVSNRL